jgi:hypothetical protein
VRNQPWRSINYEAVQAVKLGRLMTDEDIRRSTLAAAAAEAQAAWHRLYDRLLQLEFDGYAGIDPDVLPRAMEAVLRRHRADPDPAGRPFEILRQLYDEAIAEIDRKQPS